METYDRLVSDGLVGAIETPAWLDYLALGLLFGVSIACSIIYAYMMKKR